jgi:ribosomal-protein-alanine N-acetyltransferase
MCVIRTSRLKLRNIGSNDAEFILRLLNDPGFIQYIGDKQIRDIQAAKTYILEGPVASYQRFGYGLYLVELLGSGIPIGICGLIKRDFLDHADLGFALMPEYCGSGYAYESARASMELAREKFQMTKIVAFTVTDNQSSIKLLEKLGMSFDKCFNLPGDDEPVNLYSCSL